MNFTQLTVFREVMESGSISQTARKLGRTQPAISLAIKTLEKSLGLSLFDRFYNFTRGVIDTRDVVFFTLFISFFLFLTWQSLASRKWRGVP